MSELFRSNAVHRGKDDLYSPRDEDLLLSFKASGSALRGWAPERLWTSSESFLNGPLNDPTWLTGHSDCELVFHLELARLRPSCSHSIVKSYA